MTKEEWKRAFDRWAERDEGKGSRKQRLCDEAGASRGELHEGARIGYALKGVHGRFEARRYVLVAG